MEFGFLIDQRKCIGCHACTVACKAENDVPVGNFRTWVKYVDKGTFPSVRRHFTVLRCNHCDAAPCIEICPVVALDKRPDRIVDLDRDLCIGCGSCMQACPYDAIYLNDESGVAEKCHYCSHRIEIGLEPACVIVCPVEAIVSGDVADPESKIARNIAELPTAQRKVEKGTAPRVWYVDALPEALEPGQTLEPDAWLWSDRAQPPADVLRGDAATVDATTTWNADHKPVWGWHIWSYLVTKNIAAGAGMIAPFLALMGLDATSTWPEVVALVFLGITGALLVHDLGRPERFLKILTHPNPRSWLVIGTWILTAYGLLVTLGFALGLAGAGGVGVVRWLNLPLAAATSGYSAFLFAQCKGRDLWLEHGLLTTLVTRAALCGSALAWLATGRAGPSVVSGVFALAAAANAVLLLRELGSAAASPAAERARAVLGRRCLRGASLAFALIAVAACALQGLGTSIPALALGIRWLLCGAVVVLLLRLEKAWIEAGQAVPNS